MYVHEYVPRYVPKINEINMAKKIEVRKITKVAGHSLAVVLPKELADELGWREHQKIKIFKQGRSIIIRDWQKSTKKTI